MDTKTLHNLWQHMDIKEPKSMCEQYNNMFLTAWQVDVDHSFYQYM